MYEKIIQHVTWRNVNVEGQEAGFIEYARNWPMQNVTLLTSEGEPVKVMHGEDVDTPRLIEK